MPKFSRRQIEIIFVFLGVVLITSGLYSSISDKVSFMSVLYLAVGIYLIVVSLVRLNKLDAKNHKVEKKDGKDSKKS